MEELKRKYWFKNPQTFGQAMTSVGVGAITFMVMFEWRMKRSDKRLCFESLDKNDKFEFMQDVMKKMKKIGTNKYTIRLPEFEIADSIELLGFEMKDYI